MNWKFTDDRRTRVWRRATDGSEESAIVEAIADWLAAGNLPDEPDLPPVIVPAQVTMRQARLALLRAGLLSQVDSVIDAFPPDQKAAARIEWDYSQTVERHRPLVAVLAPALGLNDEQTDQLFITAATL